MTLPEIPNFFFVSISIFLLLALATVLFVGYMAVSSLHYFAGKDGEDSLSDRFKRLRKKGRVKNIGFFSIVALQFAIVTSALVVINEIRFVPHEAGLGAYTGHNTTQIDVDLAMISYCNWQDRFPPSRMDDIISGENIPLRNPSRVIPDDPRIENLKSLAAQLRENFNGEAPDAIVNLTERLTPLFAILSAFFLVCARSVVRKGENPNTYPLRSICPSVLLAFAFAMLGYFAILGYHASIEVSAAIAAGRLLCVSHVAPFFLAQVQTLVVAAVSLLLIFVMSPSSIFRRI